MVADPKETIQVENLATLFRRPYYTVRHDLETPY